MDCIENGNKLGERGGIIRHTGNKAISQDSSNLWGIQRQTQRERGDLRSFLSFLQNKEREITN
jgi:hypothetical protein